MSNLKLVLLFSLTSCVSSQQMLEVTCDSSAQSKKDGVLLAVYHMKPEQITDDKEFVFAVKDAFVERRFMMNSRTKEIVSLTGDSFSSKLVVVPTENSKTGILAVNWDARLLNDSLPVNKTLNNRESVAYRINDGVIGFRLFSSNKFECREIKAVILVRGTDKMMKRYPVTFIPKLCY